MEDAFAAWRLENPGNAGWPLDAFKAGWDARALTWPVQSATSPFEFAFDLNADGCTVLIGFRCPDGTLAVLDQAHIPPETLRRMFP